MKQDRYTEYEDVMRNASDYPTELDHMNTRLRKKIRRIFARHLFTGMGVLVGVIVLIAGAVNTSSAIAQTIERIPVIGDLVRYVKFDKGLQNAVINQYAQEVNLEQEVNGLTLKLPYVIADRKRLVLIFQLPENLTKQKVNRYQVSLDERGYEKLNWPVTRYLELKDETTAKDSGLVAISIRSLTDIPKDITLPVSLVRLYRTINGISVGQEMDGQGDAAIISSYEFKLHLNDYKEPTVTVLNKEVQVLDQTIVLQSITEYPTGIEIKAKAPNNKDAVISGLQFIGIDKSGKEWSIPEESTPALTFYDDAVDMVYYLENDYFNKISLDKLEITGVGMFMKANQVVTIDLFNKTMTPDLSDLYIRRVNRIGDTAEIIFESENDITGAFDTMYQDLKGKSYTMEGYKVSQIDSKTQYYIKVNWNKDNKVVLKRMKAPIIKLEKPVNISLGK